MIPAFCEGCEYITVIPPIRGPEGQPMEPEEVLCGYDFEPCDPDCPRHEDWLLEQAEMRSEDC